MNERPRCNCGHPYSAHYVNFPAKGCKATIYETNERGMDAWPCKCSGYVAPFPAVPTPALSPISTTDELCSSPKEAS